MNAVVTEPWGAFELNGTQVFPGQHRQVHFEIGKLYDQTAPSIRVEVLRGRKPGPGMFVSAAIHGDEINGVEIVRRLLQSKALRRLRGTLLAVPVLNIYGFDGLSRYFPDRRDLNRCFPGSERGSLASQVAYAFLNEVVAKADFGIDLHTAGVYRNNLPQVRGTLSDPQVVKLAEAFSAPVTLHAGLRDGSLRSSADEHGVPTIVYEAGEPLRFDESAIKIGVRGILSVMRAQNMLPELVRKQPRATVFAKDTHWVRAAAAGILHKRVKTGTAVREGDVMAAITGPIGDPHTFIEARRDGIVIGERTLPLVHRGDAVFHVATFQDPESAAAALDSRLEEYTGDEDARLT